MAQDNEIWFNIDDAVKTLRAEFSDLQGSRFNLAVARSINAVAQRLKTASKREALKRYKISPSELNADKNVGIDKASRNTLTARLGINVRPFPLYAFGPVKSSKGVYVTVMGSTKFLPGTFIATMKSGHTGIWGRGGYQNVKDFSWRTQRVKQPTRFKNVNGKYIPVTPNDNPIEELKTASMHSMVTNTPVLRALSTKLEDEFPDRLAKQLLKARKGY